MSLINRDKALHIYSPQGLYKYIQLGKKYSQTNFRYNLYFHNLKSGLIVHHTWHNIYAFTYKAKFEFFIISTEKFGKFKLSKAKIFNLIKGPLYGKLKKGIDILLPDGLILNGDSFRDKNNSGIKVYFIYNIYIKRIAIELSVKSYILQYSI